MPDITAENGTNCESDSEAMIRARVVLPQPGGPQKTTIRIAVVADPEGRAFGLAQSGGHSE